MPAQVYAVNRSERVFFLGRSLFALAAELWDRSTSFGGSEEKVEINIFAAIIVIITERNLTAERISASAHMNRIPSEIVFGLEFSQWKMQFYYLFMFRIQSNRTWVHQSQSSHSPTQFSESRHGRHEQETGIRFYWNDRDMTNTACETEHLHKDSLPLCRSSTQPVYFLPLILF